MAMKVYGGGTKPHGGKIESANVLDAFRYAQSLPNICTVVVGMYARRDILMPAAPVRTFWLAKRQAYAC